MGGKIVFNPTKYIIVVQIDQKSVWALAGLAKMFYFPGK